MNEKTETIEKKDTAFALTLVITSLVCLVPVALGFILWDKLPEMIPQQYGWDDQANWSLPKPIGFILCPAILLLANLVIQLALKLGKKQQNRKVVSLVTWIIPVVSLAVNCLLLLKAAGLGISVAQTVILIVSLMFVIIGNYLPKTEPNEFVGIRAPWINGNPDVWTKTNRLGGILMVVAGIVSLAACFTPAGRYVFIISTVAMMAVTLVYSIVLASRTR